MIDIFVKLSDQYELQEDLQKEELVREEIETINKEFEDGASKHMDTYQS